MSIVPCGPVPADVEKMVMVPVAATPTPPKPGPASAPVFGATSIVELQPASRVVRAAARD